MIVKTLAALALIATVGSPAYAQMNSANSTMATGDKMMPAKPMSKADTAMMARCKKMSPAMMKKSARCTKMMSMHSGMAM